MSKLIVLFFLFLMVLLFSFCQSPIYAKEQIFEIKMVKNGFVPPSLQIKTADTINFINQDKIDRWPASNIHPTHSIYPEFDPQKAIKPGESWQLKFDRAGTFKFHDHLSPSLGGAITVSGSNRGMQKKNQFNIEIFLKKIYYQIFPKKLDEDLKTFDAVKVASDQRELEYWISLIGGEKFMEKLVADSGGGSKVDCHQESHLVGRTAFELEGRKVFKKPSYNCHSGFLHGAMEAFIAQVGQKDLIKEVSKLCQSFNTDFGKFECLHGIGHGLAAYEDYNIPAALDLCKKLSSDYERRSCYGGIFMENIMVDEGRGAIKGHKTNWVSNDPHFPCSGVDKDYFVQYECYQMQTSRMLHMFDYKFSLISSECQNAPQYMVEVCFKSMGRDTAGHTLRDPLKIVDLCQITPHQYFRSCIKGALNVIIDFWGDNIKDQPQKLCQRLNEDDQGFCYGILGNRLKDIFGQDKDKIRLVCNENDKRYIDICINGTEQS